jgi:hypothetical protein
LGVFYFDNGYWAIDSKRPRNLLGRINFTRIDAIFDDAEREVVLALFAKDDSKKLNIKFVELAITRSSPLGADEPLAFEKPDFGDGDFRKLINENPKHLPY